MRSLSNLQVLNISGNVLMDLREMHETFEVSLNWPRLMERLIDQLCIAYPIDLYLFQLIPQLTHLAIADMGQLPVGLLTPFSQLRYLNISGNSLDNMALQVIDPCRQLEVSLSLPFSFFYYLLVCLFVLPADNFLANCKMQ